MTDDDRHRPSPIRPHAYRLPYTRRAPPLRRSGWPPTSTPPPSPARSHIEVHGPRGRRRTIVLHARRADRRQRPPSSRAAGTDPTRTVRAATRSPSARPHRSTTPLGPGPGRRSSSSSPASSTTSSHGFYRSDLHRRRRRHRTPSPPPSSKPPTPRRAFPCFDEPDRKAVFSVTLDVPAGLAAYSNGPERRRVPAARRAAGASASPTPSPCRPTWWPSWSARSWPPTPSTCGGTPVRIVHVPGKDDLTAFALEAAAHALRVLHRLVRHRLPGREARPPRHPRLRLRGHGEPGLRDLPRGRAPGRPGRGPRVSSSNGSPTSSRTRSPTCGSATSSP